LARRGNLDARTIEAARPRSTAYRLSDSGGLLLIVKPTGAKVWAVRLTIDGRRRDMGLGGYPTVSLREARDRAVAARKLAADGTDPIHDRERRIRDREVARKAALEAGARTFQATALAYIAAETPSWKNVRTATLWRTSLERWVFPKLGAMPVADIQRADLLRAIDVVWRSRPATGRKILRRIGAVLRYAAAHGWRSNDNLADVRMLRHSGLPALPG
jgi:hypothetical protein